MNYLGCITCEYCKNDNLITNNLKCKSCNAPLVFHNLKPLNNNTEFVISGGKGNQKIITLNKEI